MPNLTEDPQVQESFKRFASEIKNKAFAEAYLAVKDCIDQKEYCKRLKINESGFSRVISKIKKSK